LANCSNAASSFGKDQAKINRRPKAEINQKLKIIISAEKLQFPRVRYNNTSTIALSSKKTPRRRKKLTAKEDRRRKKKGTAKQTTGDLEKSDGRTTDIATPPIQSENSSRNA